MESRSRRVGLALLILIIVGLGLWNITATRGQSGSGALAPLLQAYDRIRANFYPPGRIDEQKILYGGIRGMVEELGDPYSRFLTPEEYQRFSSVDLNGEFVGVGIQIAIREGKLVVIAPLAGSPAEQAGVRAGDIVLEIDGRSTEGITLDEAVELLRGERGAPVVLKVEHEDGTIEEITVIRDLIEVDPVEYRLEGEGIGYLRITTFNRKTAAETDRALRELIEDEGVGGLILDLRSNPGGLLDEALAVASEFVDRGPILKTTDRFGTRSYTTQGNDLPDLPLAVLIDRGTASAAEILAGAIQDHQMGVLIGERSFGKGVIQTPFTLSDGSAVIITTAEYTTPNGHRVQDLGLVPDIPVTNEGEEDRQLEAAREWVAQHLGSLCPCPPPDDRGPSAHLSLPAQG
ncbi:MAG: S41 family peptidase [Candidatus Bipolaricaulia bacterium]